MFQSDWRLNPFSGPGPGIWVMSVVGILFFLCLDLVSLIWCGECDNWQYQLYQGSGQSVISSWYQLIQHNKLQATAVTPSWKRNISIIQFNWRGKVYRKHFVVTLSITVCIVLEISSSSPVFCFPVLRSSIVASIWICTLPRTLQSFKFSKSKNLFLVLTSLKRQSKIFKISTDAKGRHPKYIL